MKHINSISRLLKQYVEKESFKGYDPFDGLNSVFFQAIPLIRDNSFCRLAWLQLFKRNPINLRKLFGVKKGYNPKGLGLFLSGYCKLYKLQKSKEDLETIHFLIQQIKENINSNYSGCCWGYNFDWQARAFFQPKGTPSVVVTSYVACSLLDAYEITEDKELLDIARSACNFVLNDLQKSSETDTTICFSYSPLDNTEVYNASLLGGRLLSRVYKYTKENILIKTARKTVQFVCDKQNEDGSWTYSPLSYHSWIDNFHTGYNLECIYTYQENSGDTNFEENIKRGLSYYLDTFFEESGRPKYYSGNIYPIDLHNTAQLIILSSKLGIFAENKNMIDKVLTWSIDNMFNSSKGYFYYYKEKYFTIKIPYMRWIQAWMFFALSTYQYENTVIRSDE